MFLKFKVQIPDVLGKLVRKKRGGHTFIEYEYERTYDPEKQFTYPKRASIGKVDPENPKMMTPNESYLKYFPDAIMPDELDRSGRSPYLKLGSYVVLHKLNADTHIREILNEYMGERDAGFLLDLGCYSIIAEKNAAQYYPDYAYEHPLFSPEMKIYSDSKAGNFFKSICPEQTAGFLDSWNKGWNRRQRIYISYDSTNKNCQADDIALAEYGKAKTDIDLPVFNYSAAFDTANKEPLFYEQYLGSINDISQLTCMFNKAYGYGYRKLGFILDRGYFSQKNLKYIDQMGYSYLIIVKGMQNFIRGTVLENQEKFATSRSKYTLINLMYVA